MSVENKISAAIEARKEEIWSQFPEQEYVNEDFVCSLVELEGTLLNQALLNLENLDEGDLRAILQALRAATELLISAHNVPLGFSPSSAEQRRHLGRAAKDFRELATAASLDLA